MKAEEKSPFSRYRQGYLDGHYDRVIQMPNDDYYMNGYEEGVQDDLSGLPSKFTEDTDAKTESR